MNLGVVAFDLAVTSFCQQLQNGRRLDEKVRAYLIPVFPRIVLFSLFVSLHRHGQLRSPGLNQSCVKLASFYHYYGTIQCTSCALQ